MNFNITLASLLLFVCTGTAVACEITNKREIRKGFHNGLAGNCSNNGKAIECLNVGVENGGISCTGPEGTFTNPDLSSLILSGCGCSTDNLQEQIDQELQ